MRLSIYSICSVGNGQAGVTTNTEIFISVLAVGLEK
jgi:hypothetical protein